MVDVDSAKWQLLATKSRGPMRWIYKREARTLRAFEARASRLASTTLVVNERERDTLAGIVPEARDHRAAERHRHRFLPAGYRTDAEPSSFLAA
jgi:hypothetical protein